MTTPLLAWRVVGWDARFETRGTLRQRAPRRKISVSTDREGDELGRLLAARGGFLAFGVWNLVVRLAATCSRRGVLLMDGLPMPVSHLAGLAQLPTSAIQGALELLASPEIGLMEQVPLHEATVPAEVLAPLARKRKIKPLLQCPVCAADLTEYYQLDLEQDLEKGWPGLEGTPEAPECASGVSRVRSNPGHPSTNVSAADERGGDAKPRPSWLKSVMLDRAFGPEIEDVRQLFLRGEITREEVYHFLDTHYYERDDDEDEDWVEDEDYWQEDLLEELDIPPPQTRNW